MTRVTAVTLFGCMTAVITGCSGMPGRGSGVEFIAANSSTVLVDYNRNNDAELDAARQIAIGKCALFGGRTAVLESVNARGEGLGRATFLCQ